MKEKPHNFQFSKGQFAADVLVLYISVYTFHIKFSDARCL